MGVWLVGCCWSLGLSRWFLLVLGFQRKTMYFS